MAAHGKQRVAVLGGGIGALSAVCMLTQQDGWQDRFDITVHQLGWRLGGKGASARNAAQNQRIEEHGLHVWAGFYENAFRLMREVYAARRDAGSPIQTIEQAFLPQGHVVLAESYGGQWLPWEMYFPPQPGWPGDGTPSPLPNLAGYVSYLLDWLRDVFGALPLALRLILPAPPHLAIPGVIQSLTPAPPPAGRTQSEQLLHRAHMISQLASAGMPEASPVADALCWLMRRFRDALSVLHKLVDWHDTTIRRSAIEVDLLSSVISAIVCEGAMAGGFGVLDRYDLTEVLAKQGAWPETLASPMVTSAYDYVFGYIGGDRSKPSLSAASAFEGFFRLLFTYKRALFFKMAAGAGETIFAPIYQVLSARGVRFAFFHRVLELVPQDGRIGAIRVAIQATPIAAEYAPLVDVGGLASWPAEPAYDQLTNGTILRDRHIDLEDQWQQYSIGETTLQVGIDFDAVVLGIPAGALGSICAKLATPGSKWRAMLDATQTTCTQAVQLWSDCTLADLGGPFVKPQPEPDPVGPTLTAFAPPFDTWSDMSHLLAREDWGPTGPRNIAYFCAVLADPEPAVDPQPGATQQAYDNTVTMLSTQISALWPNAVNAANFRWDLLHAAAGLTGEARLKDQYWRANVTDSERYVLSPPGTLATRLPPAPTEYANLYLAGDWVRVASINAGCMEVAVMAGFGAAAALAGVPDDTYA